jgi:hypothetical protein
MEEEEEEEVVGVVEARAAMEVMVVPEEGLPCLNTRILWQIILK